MRGGVESHLATLVRKELIRSTAPTFPEDEGFRFRHLLIRDAAYESLPKATRAELHERFADWLSDARPRRARRDRRLPPRAGSSLPVRARPGRPGAGRARRPGIRSSRSSWPRRARPRRLQRGSRAPAARDRDPSRSGRAERDMHWRRTSRSRFGSRASSPRPRGLARGRPAYLGPRHSARSRRSSTNTIDFLMVGTTSRRRPRG